MLALLSLLTALAAPLGTPDLPDRPESRRPTAKYSERVDALKRGEGPRRLIPFNINRHAHRSVARYYDENGDVYRKREVRVLLRAHEASARHMQLRDRHQRVSDAWSVTWIATTVPLAPVSWVFVFPASDHARLAADNFELALADYNYRDQVNTAGLDASPPDTAGQGS